MKKLFENKWAPMFIISLALFVVIIDTTIINVSITDVVRDLDTDIPTIQWLITIYALVMGALLLVGGKLGDIFGRKNMFILGMFIYGIGTLVSALAPSVGVLVIGWSILEGIGGALMMPASQTLLLDNYKGKDRAVAFGAWGAIAGLAIAFGPIAGGYLTAYASWRWAFALELLVVIFVLAASFRITEKFEKTKAKLDIVGSVLSIVGLSTMVFGILQARTYGWFEAKKPFPILGTEVDFGGISITPILIAIGIFALVLMLLWIRKREKEGKEVLFSLRIFKFKDFNLGMLTLVILTIPMTGLMFTLPVFWQVVKQYDAFETGLTFLPYSITLMIFAPTLGKLSSKVPSKYIMQVGIVIAGLGLYIMAQNISVDSTWQNFALSIAVFGTGMAFFFSQIQNIILSSVDHKFAGEASGLNSTIRQLASSLGTAVVGTIFLSMILTTSLAGIDNSQVLDSSTKEVLSESMEANIDNFGGETENQSETPEFIVNEIETITYDAIVDANKQTMMIGVGFVATAFLATLGLSRRVEHTEEEIAQAVAETD